MNTVGLCMIVKNEAHVITRCLDSVRPLVDYVLIEDTGSTDGTQTIIRNWLTANDIPGEVVDVPWRDFAYNRTHAMELLRRRTDVVYAFVIDADDTLVFNEGFDAKAFKASLIADLYDVEIRHGNIRHHRPQMYRNARAFCYRGVLHEYMEVPPDAQGRETAKGFHMAIGGGGGRSQDPQKFQRDAALLEQALTRETDPFLRSRYTFYLAQSYRDCEEHEKALTHFQARAEMGFWQEEVFMALYGAAKMMERLDRPEDEVIAAYLRATDALPARVEALHGASRYCRLKSRNQQGYEIAKRGIETPAPDNGLFIEHWIYEHGLLDEFAINGYWSGHYKESLDACLTILDRGALTGAAMKRIVANARFAGDKLAPGLNEATQAPAETSAQPQRRLFACLGLHSSGSTWMFNLAREICLAKGIEYLSRHRESLDNLPWEEAAGRLILAKAHCPWDNYIDFIRDHKDSGVITVRDPRDAIVSLMQRFPDGAGGTVEGAFNEVSRSAARLEKVASSLDIPVFRYEDGFIGDPATADKIASMLGVRLTADERRQILEKLNPEDVRRTINALAAEGKIVGTEVWDLETHWHANHVGDGKVGKFKDVLAPDQVRRIVEGMQTFIDFFHYDGSARHIEHNVRFAGDKVAIPRESMVATFESCPVCGTIESTKPRPDLEPHPYVRCVRCGLFYQPYMRTKAFEARHDARDDLMSEVDRNANRSLAVSLYSNHLVPKYKSQPLLHLDIGSKYPYFGHCLQNAAAENGTQLVSHGIDGIPEVREFGRQLGVLMAVGDFEAAPSSWDMPEPMRERVAHGGFHCVSLIHCLEYFYNPLQALRDIRGLMADGGVLFIRSPDSQAPGIERDFTSGHYDIHPTIWCENAMREALMQLQGAFTIYETYELGYQRDYLLQATERGKAVGLGPIAEIEERNLAPAVKDAGASVINILRPGAIGDILATSAVTAQFAAHEPKPEIHYYTKIPQMAELLVGVDKVLDSDLWGQRKPGSDYCLIGYPLGEGYPERPMQKHLTAYFCAEAGLPYNLPQLRELKPFEIEQRFWITIHPKAGWSVYKEWRMDNWNEIVASIHRTYPGLAIVQIGGTDDPTLQGISYDLRGRTSISQALWLIKNSVLHLGVDSFSNHAAGAFEHPAVILFGSTSPTGSGYETAVNLWAGLSCSPCYRENPQLSRQSRGPCINPPGQVYEQPRHACMDAITVESVWQAIVGLISLDGSAPKPGRPVANRMRSFIEYCRQEREAPATNEVVLVTRFGGLGDLVMILPTLKQLRLRHPKAKFVLRTHKDYAGYIDSFFDDIVLDDNRYLTYQDESSHAKISYGPLRTIVEHDLSFATRGDELFHYNFQGVIENRRDVHGVLSFAEFSGIDLGPDVIPYVPNPRRVTNRRVIQLRSQGDDRDLGRSDLPGHIIDDPDTYLIDRRLSPEEYLNVIGSAAEFIGTDSSGLHLAAALRVPKITGLYSERFPPAIRSYPGVRSFTDRDEFLRSIGMEGPMPERQVAGGTKSFIKVLSPGREALAASAITVPTSPIGQIHLINLDRSKDRLDLFHLRNGHLEDVVRFPAVDGALVDRAMLEAEGLISGDLEYGPGALGCALSHIALWKKSVSQKEPLTIIEDDVSCSPLFGHHLERALQAIPEDWDIILWGYAYNPLFVWVDFGFSKAKLEFYDTMHDPDIIWNRSKEITPRLLRLAHAFGTQGYSVSPRGAQALLDYCLPLRSRFVDFPGTGIRNRDSGIDIAACEAYPKMKAFICMPPLVIPDYNLPSVIGNQR